MSPHSYPPKGEKRAVSMLAGHSVIQESDVTSVLEKGQGSSLLYGELLPDGVLQLSEALFAGRSAIFLPEQNDREPEP